MEIHSFQKRYTFFVYSGQQTHLFTRIKFNSRHY